MATITPTFPADTYVQSCELLTVTIANSGDSFSSRRFAVVDAAFFQAVTGPAFVLPGDDLHYTSSGRVVTVYGQAITAMQYRVLLFGHG
jgi:hypothetical protein